MFDHALSFQGVSCLFIIFYVNFHSKMQKKVLACPLTNKQHTKAEQQHTRVCAICAFFFLKRAFKMQFRNTYFRSLVHPSQKLWPKPDQGNFSPCILPCKIGGSQNLLKERYLSKTPNVTFVYLSKCYIKLPGIFGNSKKRFL